MSYTIQSLPIDPSESFPISKTFALGSSAYIFTFYYNSRFDFYTLIISDLSYNQLYATKLVYGQSIIIALVAGLSLPYNVVPCNIADLFSAIPVEADMQNVSAETLDDTVFLYFNLVFD